MRLSLIPEPLKAEVGLGWEPAGVMPETCSLPLSRNAPSRPGLAGVGSAPSRGRSDTGVPSRFPR